MSQPNSPDDPVFFLHHCNIDRIWALWQFQTLQIGNGYLPTSGGPLGHNLWDGMMPWNDTPESVRPVDVLNYMALGCRYQSTKNEFNGTFHQIIERSNVPIANPTSVLDTNNKPMNVEGINTHTISPVSFKVKIPKWNAIDLLSAAKLSVYLNDVELPDKTISNKDLSSDQLKAVSIPLPQGAFKVTLKSGGSDGLPWPTDTAPFVLSDLGVYFMSPHGQ